MRHLNDNSPELMQKAPPFCFPVAGTVLESSRQDAGNRDRLALPNQSGHVGAWTRTRSVIEITVTDGLRSGQTIVYRPISSFIFTPLTNPTTDNGVGFCSNKQETFCGIH